MISLGIYPLVSLKEVQERAAEARQVQAATAHQAGH